MNLRIISSRCITPGQKKLVFCGGKRQQSDAARSFDRSGQDPLVTRAVTGNPTGSHFPTLSQELGNNPEIFVIDFQGFVCAEAADFATEHRATTRGPLFVIRSLTTRPSVRFSLCHGCTCLVLKLRLPRRRLEIEVPFMGIRWVETR